MPITVKTFGPLNTSACQLFANLGRKISSSPGDERKGAFLFQRVLVLLFYATMLSQAIKTSDFSFMFLATGVFTTKGRKNNSNTIYMESRAGRRVSYAG